jgi:hypothetical protein
MRFPLSVRAVAAFVFGAALLVVPALAAEAPTLMGSFKNWYVYSMGADASRVCYALAQPASTLPKGARRDPIYIIISTWPARGVRNEPSIVPGYPYKDGVPAQIAIGNDKFTLFTANQGTAGGAWIQSPADEMRLIEAMKHGISMQVTGTSRRGTLTKDDYSLAGISAALDAIANACK